MDHLSILLAIFSWRKSANYWLRD